MNSKLAIKISGLSKLYHLGKSKDSSLRDFLTKPSKMLTSKGEEFWALKDVNLEIEAGDVVGIIGKNGAGKSTLLKILSQITSPTTGRIEINGRVASLLEVGTGFHPELTGRENIYLNGTILGMTRKEVKEKFDEIVAFSGVEKFIDTPVKHYSSGMYVRLAFAVAAHLEPEILIIDEVLAVGDAEFQKKCLGKMKEVANTGRTVLFVSHNMSAVKNLCNKGIQLEKGRVKAQGDIDSVLMSYNTTQNEDCVYIHQCPNPQEVSINRISIWNLDREPLNEFSVDENIVLGFEFEIKEYNHPYNIFVTIKDGYGRPVFSVERKITSSKMELIIQPHFLVRGVYSMETFVHIPKIKRVDYIEEVFQFRITDATSALSIHGNYDYGVVFGNISWLE